MNRSKVITIVCIIAALYVGGKAVYIQSKAVVAQILIADAWTETLETGRDTKPWPWADTWPVARLQSPSGKDIYVLHSTSGEALAFGPGLMADSSLNSMGIGTTAMAGHRDSHFAFLQHVQLGDRFTVEERSGKQTEYIVQQTEVVDSQEQQVGFQYQQDELKLITCYPFNALANRGPLRYVLTAYPIS